MKCKVCGSLDIIIESEQQIKRTASKHGYRLIMYKCNKCQTRFERRV